MTYRPERISIVANWIIVITVYNLNHDTSYIDRIPD